MGNVHCQELVVMALKFFLLPLLNATTRVHTIRSVPSDTNETHDDKSPIATTNPRTVLFGKTQQCAKTEGVRKVHACCTDAVVHANLVRRGEQGIYRQHARVSPRTR